MSGGREDFVWGLCPGDYVLDSLNLDQSVMKLSVECASERIVKIVQYLMKL